MIDAILAEPEGLSTFDLAVLFEETPRQVVKRLTPFTSLKAPDGTKRILKRSNDVWAFTSGVSKRGKSFDAGKIRVELGISPWRTVVAEYHKGTLKAGDTITAAYIKGLHGGNGEFDMMMVQMDLVLHRCPVRIRRVSRGYLVRDAGFSAVAPLN